MLAILEAPNRFNDQVAQDVARDLVAGCRATGIIHQFLLRVSLLSP